MQKFDKSCGIPQKHIGTIKYNIKNKIGLQLPELPEPIEMKLFFEGRDAWTFSWCVLNEQIPVNQKDVISIKIIVKLKKEFHTHLEIKQYSFLYNAQLTKDEYKPKISEIKNNSITTA